MTHELDLESWTCPLPLRDHTNIVMGHGAGGRLSSELVTHLLVPAFAGTPQHSVLAQLGDAAILPSTEGRIAFSTDTFVVRPRFFPGGNIGDLAVHGTVNDLAVSGAVPLAMSVGLVLEEGLALAELGLIAESMGAAARRVGVSIVTGDTKVVDAGKGDGVFVNTTGIGMVPADVDLGAHRVRPGDAVLVSGPIGLHGIAVLSVREGLEFGATIVSDTAPLHELTASLLRSSEVHVMRDPTRGGLAASLNELAVASGTGVELEESAVPVPEEVRAACGFLGLDPLYVANEGRLVAFVPEPDVEAALAALQGDPLGAGAVRIGTVTEAHPGVVVARTRIGGTRVVDLPLAEQLPRIC